MLRKVRVMDPGSTEILPGTLLDIADFTERNRSAIMNGEVPATARPVLLGITKASLETNSFLSAASFQETTRVLTDASIRGKKDHLLGLKENVIMVRSSLLVQVWLVTAIWKQVLQNQYYQWNKQKLSLLNQHLLKKTQMNNM